MVDGAAELHALVVAAADQPPVFGDQGGADLQVSLLLGGRVI